MRLYLVRCLTTDLVKIGLAKDCFRRLKQHRCGSPTPLALEKSWDVPPDQAFALEARLHRLAKPYHSHGEWFQPQAADVVRNVMS